MKKIIISILVMAFIALAATGTVSAKCAAKSTTSSCAATTCAQCTSCTTSTCCSCPCPTTCCCPTVCCCVVTQCCAVKEVKAMPVKEAREVKGEEAAGAAVAGSGQASTSAQVITQFNTQTITTGNVTSYGVPLPPAAGVDAPLIGSSINIGGSQTNDASQANVPVNIHASDIQVAWDNATAAGST